MKIQKVFSNRLTEIVNKRSIRVLVSSSILYLLVFLSYAISVNFQEKDERKGLGWLNFALVFLTDVILLVSMELCKVETSEPLKISLLGLISRI